MPGAIPDFTKAVISLWFRVPSSTITAVTNAFNTWNNADAPGPRAPLLGIVPLITFGPPVQQKGFEGQTHVVGTIPPSAAFNWSDGPSGYPSCSGAQWVQSGPTNPAQDYSQSYIVLTADRFALDPSYIGVDCTGPYPALTVHIAMPAANTAATAGANDLISYENSATGIPQYGGTGRCPGAPVYFTDSGGLEMYTVTNPPPGYDSVYTMTYTYGGPQTNLLLRPEFFRLLPFERVEDNGGHPISGIDAADQSYGGQRVTPDHWHHLLLSFDLTKPCKATGGGDAFNPVDSSTAGQRTISSCQMWVAFDDNNLIKKQLSVYWPNGYSDSNAVLPVSGYHVASSTAANSPSSVTNENLQGKTETTTNIVETPSYDFKPQPVHFTPVGIPSTHVHVGAVRHVEMSELQIFSGIAQDFSNVDSRRAFIDGNGKPVSPDKKATETDPQSGSIEFLGNEPDILLHNSGNWKSGANTGGLGSGFDFDPTGKILSYRPDPSLHGAQSPGQKP